ncbi:hypothetical protein AAZX31_10G097800 [Glycine max]
MLKVTTLCHGRAFFVRFFSALVLILLWTGKRCDLCLISTRFHFYLFSPWTKKRLTAVLKVTMFCHARAFFVRFFFSLWFLYCFGREKGVTFV